MPRPNIDKDRIPSRDSNKSNKGSSDKSNVKPYEIDKSKLKGISTAIGARMNANDDITTLFPDNEISEHIIISSILVPKDMMNVKLLLDNKTKFIPKDICTMISNEIQEPMEDKYDIAKEQTQIIRKAYIREGAFIRLTLPEKLLEDLVVSKDVMVGSEDGTPSKIADYVKVTDVTKRLRFLGTAGPTVTVAHEDGNVDVTLSEVEDGVNITDNISQLTKSQWIKNNVDDIIRYSMGREDANQLVKNMDGLTARKEQAIPVRTLDVKHNATTGDIGSPLRFNFPTEAMIPIYMPGDCTKHVGYFGILDVNGAPIERSKDDVTDLDAEETPGAKLNKEIALLKKTRQSLTGMVNKEPTLSNMNELYSKVIDAKLRSRLKSGLFGDLATFNRDDGLYYDIFKRAMASTQTTIVFIPSEYVTYYAFDYRNNGTGRSLLEKAALLYSIRGALFFSRISAEIDNNIPVTKITANIPDDDPAPDKTRAMIVAESQNRKANKLPFGRLKAVEFAEWAQKYGYIYNISSPEFRDLTIEVEKEIGSKPVPDGELELQIRDHVNLLHGITPEMIDGATGAEFATTYVFNNIMLAKRAMLLQDILTPHITKDYASVLRYDAEMRHYAAAVIKSELSTIVKHFKKQIDDELFKTFDKASDEDKIEYLLNAYISGLVITLPRPVIMNNEKLQEEYESYTSKLEDVLDRTLSEDAYSSDVIGEAAEYVAPFKSMAQAILTKNWCKANNYLPDAIELISRDYNDVLSVPLLEELISSSGDMTQALLSFAKGNLKRSNKTNDTFSKYLDGDFGEDKAETPVADDTTETPVEGDGGGEVTPDDTTETPAEGDGGGEVTPDDTTETPVEGDGGTPGDDGGEPDWDV